MSKKFSLLMIVITAFVLFGFLNFAKAEMDITDAGLYNSLKGKIILKVETNGEAYYVSPNKQKMYFLSRPADAFKVMREQGIGITNSNLEKITEAKSFCSSNSTNCDVSKDTFSNMHKGKIFLQVEENGEAWYINPNDAKRYFMGRPSDAFSLMRNLGLGISNENFEKMTTRGMPNEEDLPRLSINFNNYSCEQNNSYAKFDILKNEQIAANTSVSNCESKNGEFITSDNNYGYFSILLGGLGGYIIYGKYANLYRLNLDTNSVEKIFDRTLTDVDFSSNLGKVVYRKDDKLVIKNLNNFSEVKFELPTENSDAQFGSFKFSPDDKKVAIAVGYGPDNEKGEIYKLEIESGSYSLQGETDSPSIVIDGWDTNGNIVWRKK